MTGKSFSSAPKPKRVTNEKAADTFERAGAGHDQSTTTTAPPEVVEPVKRLSIDMPETLHHRFKLACTATRRKMVGELIVMIEKRTAELEAEIKNSNLPSLR